jgi:hypothetical protein
MGKDKYLHMDSNVFSETYSFFLNFACVADEIFKSSDNLEIVRFLLFKTPKSFLYCTAISNHLYYYVTIYI